jgi:uncharacterized protein
VILYMRTMHSHDMFQRTMEVQAQAMQQMLHDTILKDKGSVPPDFDAHFKKIMDDVIKNFPMDEFINAMIPAYQKYFTESDIEAMNAFYSSPVGQKVLQQQPLVMQEGMQAAMPIMTNYISEWKDKMKHDVDEMEKSTPKTGPDPKPQN